MKIKYKNVIWTEQDFLNNVGFKPEQHDLERCNCPDKESIDHRGCGICDAHNIPVFMCHECFYLINIDELTHINELISKHIDTIINYLLSLDTIDVTNAQLTHIKTLNETLKELIKKRDVLSCTECDSTREL